MPEKWIVKRETRELKILTRPRINGERFCPFCERGVRWLAPEEAMILAQKTLREIFRALEAGELHCVENEDGFVLVCAESLAAGQPK